MGYPARYRNPGPQTGFRPSRGLPRSSATIIPFPGRYRSPRLPLGPPTRLPGRANFGLRPKFRPPSLRPTFRPSPAFGVSSALGAILWWGLNQDFNWAGQPMPYLPGWEHVCGPFPWPGPPYLHQRHWEWFGVPSLACNVPLGGQAGFADLPPTPSSDLLYFGWGPNDLNRYYAYDQYTRPAGSSAPDAGLRPHFNPAPGLIGPGANLAMHPNAWNPNPIPPPIRVSPFFPPEPPYPQGPSRGYTLGSGPSNTRGRVQTISDVHGNSFTIAHPSAPPRDRRPPPREKERKAELGSALGRAIITGFKALQTWGQINGAVDSLWRALPARSRTPGASWWQKYVDVYDHFDEIDLGKAAANAAVYAARIRAFGYAFDRTQRHLDNVLGPNGSRSITRGFSNMGIFGRRLTTRKFVRNYSNRRRAFSGRSAPYRRYQQFRLRRRKNWRRT